MKKHREKYASTWSEQEKKAILASEKNLTPGQEHQERMIMEDIKEIAIGILIGIPIGTLLGKALILVFGL